jgi:translation elongation factor EF-Ts
MAFKKFNEYINESLAFLTLKKTMKNEFMNNMELKNDFENAKRQFYVNGNSLLTHIAGEEFELRSMTNYTAEDLDALIKSHVNTTTEKLKFRRIGKSKIDKIKEYIWLVKAEIE